MGSRGRKSSARLGVIEGLAKRPEPPDELTPEQAEEWAAVVRRMPVHWFHREIWPLLSQYCRHIVNARHVAGMIEDAHEGDMTDGKALMRLTRLLGMQQRQTSALVGLATRMRLTNQARYTAQSAATQSRGDVLGRKPWEKEGWED